MTHNRNCTICGKEYQYCPHCAQYASMPKWYSRFCGEECKDIYDVINKFAFSKISAKDAKDALSGHDLSKLINDNDKKIVENINAIVEAEKPKKFKKRFEPSIVESEVKEEIPAAEEIAVDKIVNVD